MVERNTPKVINAEADMSGALLLPVEAVQADSHQVEVASTQIQHPFILIEEATQTILEATRDGSRIQVSPSIGRFALIMGAGADQGKTKKELYDQYLALGRPRSRIWPQSFIHLLVVTREAVEDYAPPIVTTQRYVNGKRVHLYHYDDNKPWEDAEGFEAWDEVSTCIRFDRRNQRLTVAREGVRTSATVLGGLAQHIFEYLLARPNQDISARTLSDHLREVGHTGDVRANVDALRKWIKRHLKQDPHGLIETESTPRVKGSRSIYTLRADRVEIVEDDGSVRLTYESSTDELDSETEQLIDARDLATIALGFRLQQQHIDAMRGALPSALLPKEQFLDALALQVPVSKKDVSKFVADNVDRCLLRVKTILDSQDANSKIQNWSPVDARLKVFLETLQQLDRFRFKLYGERVRGIDLLGHLLKSTR